MLWRQQLLCPIPRKRSLAPHPGTPLPIFGYASHYQNFRHERAGVSMTGRPPEKLVWQISVPRPPTSAHSRKQISTVTNGTTPTSAMNMLRATFQIFLNRGSGGDISSVDERTCTKVQLRQRNASVQNIGCCSLCLALRLPPNVAACRGVAVELAAEFRASVLKNPGAGSCRQTIRRVTERFILEKMRINKDTRRMPPKRIGCVLSLEFREE